LIVNRTEVKTIVQIR